MKFNIDRPKISDEEINRQKNFNDLVRQFKQQSIKRARGDESWWKDKKVRYSTVIAGVTVVCTITYLSLFNNNQQEKTKHDNITTQSTPKQNTKTTENSARPFIQAPSAKLKTSYTAYKVDNSKGASITHPS